MLATRAVLVLAVLTTACGETALGSDAAVDDAGVDAAGSDAGPPLRVRSVVDLGELAHPSATVVGRDGASSGVIDGQLLWTFGDTFVSMTTPVDDSNVVTATGAWATPAAPLTLEQPVDARGIPRSSSRTRTWSSIRTGPARPTAGRSGRAQ